MTKWKFCENCFINGRCENQDRGHKCECYGKQLEDKVSSLEEQLYDLKDKLLEDYDNHRIPNVEGLSHLRVLNSVWFPINVFTYADKGTLSTIGIVKVYNTETKEINFYIGCGEGKSIQYDEDLIVSGSSKYYPECLVKFFEGYKYDQSI